MKMKESTKRRIEQLGLSEEEFEPKPDTLEEQVADLTDLVTILTEVIANG